MKILVLHLSDMHAQPESIQFQERINALNGVINQLAPGVSRCFIVVCGDIAYSGCHEQYSFARDCLLSLKHQTESKELFDAIEYIVVPGNHDVSQELDDETRKTLIKHTQENATGIDQSLIEAVTKAQAPFFDFQREICRKPELRQYDLYYRFVFDEMGIPIIFNCFNTAWMSTIPDSQGKLRFPIGLITMESKLDNPISFSVLHHPYNWFNWEDAKSLRNLLLSNSNFILTGHEHDRDIYKQIDAKGRVSDYYEGGLFNTEGCHQSSFNAVLVDVETRKSQLTQFIWSQGNYQLVPETQRGSVQERHPNSSYVVNQEYMKKTLDGFDYNFKHPKKDPLQLSDIYVNPDLERTISKGKTGYSTVRVGNLEQLLRDEKPLLVVGAHQLGKTALLRRLFCGLLSSEQQLVPIIVDGASLKTVNEDQVSKLVERTFESSYSKGLVHTYVQLPRTQKVLMIDDFDKSPLNLRGRVIVLKQLEGIFGHIILAVGSPIDIEELTVGVHTSLHEYVRVEICEFGYYLRRQLIEQWLRVGDQFNVEETELQNRLKYLEHEINSVMGNHVLPYNPFIILTLLQAADFNYDISTATGAYGYYYELLIKHIIIRTSSSTRETGIKMGFLSCLAYYMFTKAKQHVDSSEMTEFCANVYLPHSRLTIDLNRIIRELVNSGILVFDDQEGRYLFAHRYEYEYFTGLFMADNFKSTDQTLANQIKCTIMRLCNNLHKESYSNIVMFLSFLLQDSIVLDLLAANADMLFSHVSPCDLAEDVQFINKFEPKSFLSSFAAGDKEGSREIVLREQDRIEREDNQALLSQGEVETINELNFLPSVAYSFSLINILGQILKNYLGILGGGQLQKIVDVCYRLGLRVLKTILMNMEKYLPDLREEYRQSLEEKGEQLLEYQLNERFVGSIYQTSLLLSMLVLRSLTFAVGAPELESIYEDTGKKLNMVSVTLLNMSIRLEYYREPPVAEIININKTLEKNAFGRELLKHTVVLNMYLYEWRVKRMQQVLSEFGLKVQGDPRFLLPTRKLLTKAERTKQSPKTQTDRTRES